jgi:hypothetical protein
VAAEPAVRDSPLLSIGEVLALLRAEFPDTTISKLRFLETEGLVQPQRTPSGYRKYSRDDVARLRYVLAAQRDQYLPLRVIRQQLDEGAHLPPSRPALVSVPPPGPTSPSHGYGPHSPGQHSPGQHGPGQHGPGLHGPGQPGGASQHGSGSHGVSGPHSAGPYGGTHSQGTHGHGTHGTGHNPGQGPHGSGFGSPGAQRHYQPGSAGSAGAAGAGEHGSYPGGPHAGFRDAAATGVAQASFGQPGGAQGGLGLAGHNPGGYNSGGGPGTGGSGHSAGHGAGQAEPVPALPAARYRRAELLNRAGIGEDLLADLQRHGLVSEQAGGWFDADALAVAEVAGQLAVYGLQPRHLRPYKVAADREAGLLAQIVMPLMRQQSPAHQGRADEALRELLLLSQRLHLALLRSGLSETLGP